MIRCMQCMEEYDERLDRCPHCHQQPQAPEPFQLPYGTMLDDRFLVGAMLGHGGFGITYIGWDTLLDQSQELVCPNCGAAFDIELAPEEEEDEDAKPDAATEIKID